ncbi:MAG: alpha/beta hydrolase-fold protein [Promethearchaeota archaeon]
MPENNKRFRIDNFHAKALDGNPLGSSADRDLKIYLPPGYFESNKRYPVVYFLHGYGGNNRGWTVTGRKSKDGAIPWNIIPKQILKQINMERLITFETLDEQIANGQLDPFIFVQPDASLHVPNIDGRKDIRGHLATKGSFYINSPFSGNYRDYIIQDVINYIDSNYRTIPDKPHRALMGGSMGGFGTLYLCLHHPEKFVSAASLSPGNLGTRDLSRIDWKLKVPIYEEIFGAKMSDEIGDSAWRDIIDTIDLVFSDDNRLLPTIKRDESGNVIDYNEEILSKWEKFDINYLIKENPDAFKQVQLLLNCADNDEFGLAEGAKKIHETLIEYGIDHQFELYSDPGVALTPHILGIGYHILQGIHFCTEKFAKN